MDKQCRLIEAIGNNAECPRGWCPFWESGGAVLEAGCGIERLGIDLSNRELAYYLVDLRRALEGARDAGASERARLQLTQLAPPELSGA